mgnify:CR=1 FL=1
MPVLFTGCCGLGENQFAKHYSNPILEDAEPPEVKPEIITTENLSEYNAKISELTSQGSTVMGSSNFNSHTYSVCKSHLKSLAKKQGADYAVATSKFTNQTRKVETVREHVPARPIYDNQGNKVGEVPGYWHDVQRTIIRNYYDYKATLLRGVIETAPVTP